RGSIPLGGVPLGGVALGGVPLGGVPLGGVPLGGVPLGSVPLGSVPLGGVPLGSVPLGGVPLGGVPLGGVPLGGVPLCGLARNHGACRIGARGAIPRHAGAFVPAGAFVNGGRRGVNDGIAAGTIQWRVRLRLGLLRLTSEARSPLGGWRTPRLHGIGDINVVHRRRGREGFRGHGALSRRARWMAVIATGWRFIMAWS